MDIICVSLEMHQTLRVQKSKLLPPLLVGVIHVVLLTFLKSAKLYSHLQEVISQQRNPKIHDPDLMLKNAIFSTTSGPGDLLFEDHVEKRLLNLSNYRTCQYLVEPHLASMTSSHLRGRELIRVRISSCVICIPNLLHNHSHFCLRGSV